MSSVDTFPSAAWLRRQVSSRRTRRVLVFALAIVAISFLLLRVEAAIFEKKVSRVLAGLASLRIGETSKAEVLAQVPELTTVDCSDKDLYCDSGGRFSITIRSRLSDWALEHRTISYHERLFLLLNWCGFRYEELEAQIDLTGDTVSHFNYWLMASGPRIVSNPRGLIISVSSKKQITDRPDWELDESPDYHVSHMKWPTLARRVEFTSRAPIELVQHAFDVHLECMSYVQGCKAASELLPEAERDRLAITKVASERAQGPDQCPLRILPHRTHDLKDILLVQVKRVGETPFKYFGDDISYQRDSFELLRVLKGSSGRPLEDVAVASEIYFDTLRVHNSAVDLLHPGQQVLLFSGASTNIDEPCEAMAASEDAVRTIEDALRKTSLRPKS